MGETLVYGIAEEKGIWRVYYLLDPHKVDKEQNRRYVGSFDREDRAREYMETRRILDEKETNDKYENYKRFCNNQ